MRLDPHFFAHVEALPASLDRLVNMRPFIFSQRTTPLPTTGGVYLFTEADQGLYVGRAKNLRNRLGQHCRQGTRHNAAGFAFLLARHATNQPRPTYRRGEGRAELIRDPRFMAAFVAAKERISRMRVRYVEEDDPIRQMLLEVYAAIALKTPYNDFETH
jgi:hypothetical protein